MAVDPLMVKEAFVTGQGAATGAPTANSRFAVWTGRELSQYCTALHVAWVRSHCHAFTETFAFADDVRVWVSRYRASTPATWGAAIEVPVLRTNAFGTTEAPETSSLRYDQVEAMLPPGAKMSTHWPWFENEDSRSM